MLFRPRKAVYIGRWRVPFTPGLIPQQKSRIAASVGKVISRQLLNPETLRETLLSKEALGRLESMVKEVLGRYEDDWRTVGQVLGCYVEEEKINACKQAVKEQGIRFFMEKIEQAGIGTRIVQQEMRNIREKVQAGMFGMFLDEGIMRGAGNALGKIIDDLIREKAPELVGEELGKVEEELLCMEVCDIYESQKSHIPGLAGKIVRFYEAALDNNLDRILEAVDIGRIVEEKVNSFDAVQLEDMIFGIMKKELNAIVYLGALLGFMMGFVNLLF